MTHSATTPSLQVPEPAETGAKNYVLLALASLIILGIFIAWFYQSNATRDALGRLEEHAARTEHLDRLLISLLKSETGVRGFLISGHNEYLQPYNEAIAQLDKDLALILPHITNLRKSGEAEQLRQLVRKYEILAQDLIQDKKRGGTANLLDLYRGNNSLEYLKSTVAQLKQQLTEESQAFYQRTARSQSVTRWAVFGLCLAALVLVLWLFWSLQRQARLRRELALALHERASDLESEVVKRTAELTSLAAQLTRVSEEEKMNLARELHDDLGASLTAAKMDAAWLRARCQRLAEEQACQKTERLILSLNHAIDMKRRLTSNLMPPLLRDLGLFDALEGLADDLRADGGVEVVLRLPQWQPELDSSVALALFRVTQEAITNVRKYARAKRIGISIALEKDRLQLCVEDDGCGFDPEHTGEKSFGIISMRHRCQLIGGHFKLHSSPGQGTRIVVTLAACAHHGDPPPSPAIPA